MIGAVFPTEESHFDDGLRSHDREGVDGENGSLLRESQRTSALRASACSAEDTDSQATVIWLSPLWSGCCWCWPAYYSQRL